MPDETSPPLSEAAARRARETPMRGEKNQNPSGIGLFALLREDFRVHGRMLLSPGFWAIAVNRFGNWRMDVRPKLVRAPFSLLYELLYAWVLLVFKIELPYIVKVGRRVRIWHHGSMVLGARSIGDDVVLRHNMTMGVAHDRDPIHEIPWIEERVEVGCGAVIVGPITVGHDARIGANAVVVDDVPPGAVVVGIPGRVVRIRTLGQRPPA